MLAGVKTVSYLVRGVSLCSPSNLVRGLYGHNIYI